MHLYLCKCAGSLSSHTEDAQRGSPQANSTTRSYAQQFFYLIVNEVLKYVSYLSHLFAWHINSKTWLIDPVHKLLKPYYPNCVVAIYTNPLTHEYDLFNLFTRVDTGQRLVDRMPINPKIAVFESTQERYVDIINLIVTCVLLFSNWSIPSTYIYTFFSAF